MYTYDDIKQEVIKRYAHNYSMQYVRTILRYNRYNQSLDYYSKQLRDEQRHCTLLSYTILLSSTVLVGSIYYISRRAVKKSILRRRRYEQFNSDYNKYNQLFNNNNIHNTNNINYIIQHTNINTPIQQFAKNNPITSYNSTTTRSNKRLSNATVLLLCCLPIIYGLTGRRVNDHCIEKLMNRNSDLSIKCKEVYNLHYNRAIDSFNKKQAISSNDDTNSTEHELKVNNDTIHDNQHNNTTYK